jgi:hypothetical protein
MSVDAAIAYANRVGALAEKFDPGVSIPACAPKYNCVPLLYQKCSDAHFRIRNMTYCIATNAAQLAEAQRTAMGSGSSTGGEGSNNGTSGNTSGGASGAVGSNGSGSAGSGGSSTAGGSGSGGGNSGNAGGGSGIKSQPMGELISVNLELIGLRGQQIFLSWSIFQKSGSGLSKNWLGGFITYRLVATTDDDTGTLQMWVPLPRQHGPYFIRLDLMTANGADLAGMSSNPFG